jgi:RNA polymerase sigma-70 factor (ECF subfamily)
MGQADRNLTDGDEIAASLTDPERFGMVAERHFAEIFRYLARRVGRDAAQDLGAETFVIAFNARIRYDVSRTDARPWLYGIATNLIRRHRRSELRMVAAYARSASPERGDEVAEGLAGHLDHVAALARVATAFAQLEPGQRDALYLIAIEGLSYTDVAEALAIPVGTVHSRVARARAKLRDLADYFGQEGIEDAITASEGEG